MNWIGDSNDRASTQDQKSAFVAAHLILWMYISSPREFPDPFLGLWHGHDEVKRDKEINASCSVD